MPRRFLVVPSGLVTIGGAVGLGFAIWITPRLKALGEATAAPISQRDTFMDAISGISPALWATSFCLLGIFGVAMLLAGAASTALAWQRHSFAALLVLGGAMAVPVCLATAGVHDDGALFLTGRRGEGDNHEMLTQPDALVACEGRAAQRRRASTIILNAPVHWVNTPFEQDYPQRVLQLGRDLYWDDAAVHTAWASGKPVYLIIDDERLSYWQDASSKARASTARVRHGTCSVIAE